MIDVTDQAVHAPAPRQRYTWKRLFIFSSLVVLMAVAILAAGIYAITGIQYPEGENPIRQAYNSLSDPGSVAFANKPRLNVLVLGVDYNQDNKGIRFTKWARSDTMFILSLTKDAGSFNILSIPRDCRVDIPGHGMDKINAAFSLKERGDVELAKLTVERFLGVTIDHVVVVKEYAAQRVVDILGGVTVDVEKNMDYDDNWGHLFIHLKKGVQHLNGLQAVGYVRFRHDAEGDRGRIVRQQQFMQALLREVRKPQNLTAQRIKELVRAVKENIETTLSFSELLDLAMVYKNFNRKNIQTGKIDGTDAYYDGQSCIDPDERTKAQLVNRLLLGNQSVDPAAVNVEVLNGSEFRGAAGDLARELRTRGYQVARVGDATTHNEPESYLVDHRNNEALCRAIEKTFFGQIKTFFVPQTDGPDVTIVLGSDWATRYKPYQSSPAPEASSSVFPSDTLSPSPYTSLQDARPRSPVPSATGRSRRAGERSSLSAPAPTVAPTPYDGPPAPRDSPSPSYDATPAPETSAPTPTPYETATPR